MKGCVLRGLTSWMARATSSLPLPDSPCTSTGAMLRASFSTRARTPCIADDVPAMPHGAGLTCAARGGRLDVVAFAQQRQLVERSQVRLVVDDQQAEMGRG